MTQTGIILPLKMEECEIYDSILFLIREYAYQLQQLNERVSYYHERWIHVTLNNCHPTTCHDDFPNVGASSIF